MGDMVLQLITATPQPQMFFGPPQMIVRASPDPIVIRMCCGALAHYLRHYFQRLGEWFHPNPFSSPDRLTLGPRRAKRRSVSGRGHLAKPEATGPLNSRLREDLSNLPSSRHFESPVEIASARSDAIRATIAPAFLKTSISILTSDGCVNGSGCTR